MLRSNHFLFRPLHPDDAPAFVEAVRESADSLRAWMPWAHADYALADAQAWIAYCGQEWQQRSSFEFGIFDAASGGHARSDRHHAASGEMVLAS